MQCMFCKLHFAFAAIYRNGLIRFQAYTILTYEYNLFVFI